MPNRATTTCLAAAVLVLAGAGASGTALAQATAVTTNTYSASSLDSDIDASCKALSASSSGTVSATCNKSSGNNAVGNSTSKDVSANVGCGHSMGVHTSIHWGSDTTVHWSPKDGTWKIKLDSTGKKYLLEAKCVATDGWTANASTIELGASDGLDNDSGDLDF